MATNKFMAYEYVLPSLKVSETRTVQLRLVDAKSAYFDLLALIAFSGLTFGLQTAFKYIGFDTTSSKKRA